MMDNTRDLRVLLGSRHPLVMAEVPDEVRFMEIVRREAGVLGLPVWLWSSTTGLRRDGGGEGSYLTANPLQAVTFVAGLADPGVFVFADFQHALEDPIVLQKVKEAAQAAKPGQTLLLEVSRLKLPPELEAIAIPWRLELPTREEMAEIVWRNLMDLKERGINVALTSEQMDAVTEACRGLSAALAAQVLQQAALGDNAVTAEDIEAILKNKAEVLSQGGILELQESTAGTLDAVGGMRHLKEWLALRGRAFEPAAKEFGLEAPRGVLLTGVPGCGKSLVAKTLARTWKLPLVLLDPARLYGPYVGQSEETLRSSLATVAALAPVVLWVDEIEKGFATGSESDGGVSQRILGSFLRWMQDRPPGVFVVATCNEVLSIPPEFLRKGRFDETFFVDLPDPEERAEIIRLHLQRRKRDPTTFDVAGLAAATDGFSGSELEAVIVGAMYRAYARGEQLDDQDLLAEVAATVPLSRMRAADIAKVREWGGANAVPAG